MKDMVTFLRKCVFCDYDASKMNAAKSCCVCGNVVVVVVVKQLYLFFVPPLFSKVTKKRAKIIFTTKKIVQSRKSKVSPVLNRKGLSKRKGLSSTLLVCVRPLLHAIYYFEKNKRKRGHLMMRSHQTISLVIVFGNFSNPPNIPLDLND